MELPIRLPHLSLSWKGKPWKPLDHLGSRMIKIQNRRAHRWHSTLTCWDPSGIILVQWRNWFPIFFPDHFPRLWKIIASILLQQKTWILVHIARFQNLKRGYKWRCSNFFWKIHENPVLNHRMERGTAGYRRPPTFCRSARCCNPFARTSGDDDQSWYHLTWNSIIFFT